MIQAMGLKSSLIKVGFPDRDADIYLSLIELGESSVGKIIEKVGLHRELVYGALKRLEQQGLIRSIEKRKIRYYIAEHPKVLTQKIVEKAELAKNIESDLANLFREVPIMVRVYEGPEGYEEIQKDIQRSLESNENYYVIGAAGTKWYEITKEFYKIYRKKSLKRNIHAQMVTYTNQAKNLLAHEVSGFADIRVLPQEFAVPSSTKIYADKIILQIFGERPVAVMIQSKAAADAYKKYFQTLWDIGKSVKSE